MIIKKISFFTIVSLLILEIYFNYYQKDNNENFKVNDIITGDDNNDIDNNDIDNTIQIENLDNIPKKIEKIIKFKIPSPWTQITKNKNYSRFYIKINNFNEDLFLKWKKLVGILDYDIDTKSLIIETKHNYEALSIVNLLISNMNNNITLEEIIKNNLLGTSINKAKSHKLVRIKLVDLIKENNNNINYPADTNHNNINYSADTNNNNINYPADTNHNNINYPANTNHTNINYSADINNNNINYPANTNNNNFTNNNNIDAYEGSEFSFI